MKPAILFFAFVCIVIVGCLSHELGHFTVARILHCNARIHYASTSIDYGPGEKYIISKFAQYPEAIKAGHSFPGREKFIAISNSIQAKNFYFTLAGPIQTILTSLLALTTLLLLHRYQVINTHSPLNYLLIGLTCFILRQPVNMAADAANYILSRTPRLTSDENRISTFLHLPWWTLSVITGSIGLAVFAFTVYKFVAVNNRRRFLFCCFTGGSAGYILWLYILGPVILP